MNMREHEQCFLKRRRSIWVMAKTLIISFVFTPKLGEDDSQFDLHESPSVGKKSESSQQIMDVFPMSFHVPKSFWSNFIQLKTFSFFLLSHGSKQCLKLVEDTRFCINGRNFNGNSRNSISAETKTVRSFRWWMSTRWWQLKYCFFNPTWGNDPIWRIFFKWVETTN